MTVPFVDMMLLERAKKAPEFVIASTTGEYGSSSLTFTNPSGQSGDHAIMVIWGSNISSASSPGWTTVSSNFSGALRFAILRKTWTDSEGASTLLSTNASSSKVGILMLYRGGSGLVDVVGTKEVISSSLTSSAPSINASQYGTLIAAFARDNTNSIPSSPPNGMTSRVFRGGAGGVSINIYDLMPSLPGLTGAKSVTYPSGTDAVSAVQFQIY